MVSCTLWTLLQFVLAYISGLFTMILFNAFSDCSVSCMSFLSKYALLPAPESEQFAGDTRMPAVHTSVNVMKQVEDPSSVAETKVPAQATGSAAFESAVSPNLLNAKSRISHPGPHGLKFIHISKTGGTTVEEIGQRLPDKLNWGMFDRPFYGYQHNRFRHLPVNKRRQYDWFLIVRDPVDRFVSEYHCGLEGVNYMIARNHSNADFNNWLQQRLRKGETSGGHFIPMSDYLDPDPLVIQHIIRFENLEADLRHVLGLYNISLQNRKIPKRNNGQKRFFSRQNMSQETLAHIRYFYAGDFVNFGYPMPWQPGSSVVTFCDPSFWNGRECISDMASSYLTKGLHGHSETCAPSATSPALSVVVTPASIRISWWSRIAW